MPPVVVETFASIWRFITLFTGELYTASRFRIQEYDIKMQATVSPTRRAITWIVIALVILGGVLLTLTLMSNLAFKVLRFSPSTLSPTPQPFPTPLP